LVHAGRTLKGLQGDNPDQTADIAIIRKALQAPLRQIAENVGVDGSVVAGKVLENGDRAFGYDAQSESYSDMLKAGVIDPTKVVRIALEHAAPVAGLLVTTEAMVADKSKKSGGSMHDMGGMM
jgi:chaperonin GroEL